MWVHVFTYMYMFCVGSEDSTVYPEDFDEIMVRQAKQIFEKDFRKGVPAEKIEKNINDLLEFLKDCLAERKLVLNFILTHKKC